MNPNRVLYDLRDEVNNIKMDIVSIKATQNEERQYNQKYSVLAHGFDDVPVAPVKPSREYRKTFVKYVVDKLNTLLDLDTIQKLLNGILTTHIFTELKRTSIPKVKNKLLLLNLYLSLCEMKFTPANDL